MWTKLLADALVVIHLGFVVFAVLGGLTCLIRRWLVFVHLPAAIWACLIEFQGWICPLTYLENSLRAAAGASGYEGGFVERYLLPTLYPSGLEPATQTVLGFIALGMNVAVYGFVVVTIMRRRTR